MRARSMVWRLPALSNRVDTPLRGFLAPLRSVPSFWLKAGNRKSSGIRSGPLRGGRAHVVGSWTDPLDGTALGQDVRLSPRYSSA